MYPRELAEVPVGVDADGLREGFDSAALFDVSTDRGRDVIPNLQRRPSAVISQLMDESVIAGWVDPDATASLLVAAANGIAL